MLTTTQVATLLGISDQTVRRLITKGSMPGVRMAGDSWYRVQREQLAEYAQEKGIRLDWSLIEDRQTA